MITKEELDAKFDKGIRTNNLLAMIYALVSTGFIAWWAVTGTDSLLVPALFLALYSVQCELTAEIRKAGRR